MSDPVRAQRSRKSGGERILPLVLVLLLLLGGSWIRLANLGEGDLNADALDHVYAAQSLERGEPPVLPSGNLYERGIDVTRLIGVADDVIDDPEAAARLPSALFGILGLVLFAAIAWAFGGPWTAVWATLLLAIYPEAITQSRQTRFYTYQMLFGLLALFTGWRALRGTAGDTLPDRGELRRRWWWGAATVVLFMLGARVQVTTLSVAAGWAAFVALAAGLDLRRHGRRAWKRSAPVHFTIAGLGGVLGYLLLDPEFLGYVQRAFTYTPSWVRGEAGALHYYYGLYEHFPLLAALTPLVFLALALRHLRLAGYLLLWFAVPLVLHSLVFAWKGERFILLAMPALFLATAIVAARGCTMLYRAVKRNAREWKLRSPWNEITAGALVGITAAFAVATNPAHDAVLGATDASAVPSWSTAHEIVRQIPGHESIPLGSSLPLNALYYWGRVDFVVGMDFLESPEARSTSEVRHETELGGEGVTDFYAGAPTLTKPSSILDRYPEADTLVIGIDQNRWIYGNIRPELKRALGEQAVELCRGRCGKLLLFLWTDPRSIKTRVTPNATADGRDDIGESDRPGLPRTPGEAGPTSGEDLAADAASIPSSDTSRAEPGGR